MKRMYLFRALSIHFVSIYKENFFYSKNVSKNLTKKI